VERIFTIEADEWSAHGYIYRDGLVIAYETDRKEQTHREFDSRPAAEFTADEKNLPELRDWVRACVQAAAI